MDEIRNYVRHHLLCEFLRGQTAAETVRKISVHVPPEYISHSMAKYWFHRFRQGDFNLNDHYRVGNRSVVNIRRLRELVEANPKRSVRNLAYELNCTHSTIRRHLFRLGMKFNDGRWGYSKEASNLNKNAACDTQSSSVESLTTSISDSDVLSETSIQHINSDWTNVESWELDRYLGPV